MLPRKLEDLDDDSPTQLIRTRVMRREEVAASSVVPVARPTRPAVPSVRLRKRLASTPPAPAAVPADEALTEIHARVVPPAPETAPLPPTLPAVPSARAAYEAPPASTPQPAHAQPPSAPPHAVAPPPGHPASDTFAPTSFAAPTSAPPPHAPPASDTFAATSFATPASLRARTPTPAVRVTYRPLALDLDPSLANDPGATQPSRRRRIEAASRRNWAAIAIAGGFMAGLLGSAVALTSSVGAAPSVARASRIHVPSTLPLEITSSSHVKAVEVEEGAASPEPRTAARGHATSTRAAKSAPTTAHAPRNDAPSDAKAAEPKPADPPPEEKTADAPTEAKSPAVDLAGKDLLTDGL